jgi:hypothetical protein
MKKPKQKHYFATIKEQQGKYEHESRYLFKTAGDPFEIADSVSKTWYPADSEPADNGGYWHNGEIISSVGEVKEIPASHFAILKKYLSVL